MNNYFFDLPTKIQEWFLNNGTQPSSASGANKTMQDYLKHFAVNSFIVKLSKPLQCKNGEVLDQIVINKDSVFSAYLPEVWQCLNIEQKIQLIFMTYNTIIENDKTLKNNAPKLAFFQDDVDDFYYGLYNSKENVLTLQISKIIEMKNGFDIPSIIAHELTHAKQELEREKLLASKKPLNEMSFREVAIIFSATSAYKKALNFFQETNLNDIKDIITQNYNITEQDIEIYENAKAKNDDLWQIVYRLPYLCHPMELEAYRTQSRFRNAMIDKLAEKFKVNQSKHEDGFKMIIEELNDNNKLKLTNATLENLVKLNFALGSTFPSEDDCLFKDNQEAFDLKCNALKTLIDVYNKKEIITLDYLDYEDLLHRKQENLLKNQRTLEK